MVFSSTIFLFAFLPVTLCGYYLLDRNFKNVFLLLMSLLFYAWGEPKFVFIMIGSILVNHIFALIIDKDLKRAEELKQYTTGKQYGKRAKTFLRLSVLFNLSLFFLYKYVDFTISNINAITSLFGAQPIPLRNISLPIGISFFTFQAMSYVFDVYRRKGQAQKNPMNTALYIALFPQLIAGPIVRYETVASEISNRKETLSDFAQGTKRFILGLSKKVILSNSLAVLADRAFGYTDFSQLTVLFAWFGGLCYMMQIYFDFGGYSDMAIGLGLMFGFHFNENFNYPYIARTVSDFWRRWHISLSSWFRDYMFLPISTSGWLRRMSVTAKMRWGGRTRQLVTAVVPMAIVWFCTGLWHGASWNYVLWGCWYGLILIMSLVFDPSIKKLTKKLHIHTEAKCFHALQHIRTLVIVLIADVFFRTNTLNAALHYLGSMLGLTGNRFCDVEATFLIKQSFSLVALSILFCTPILKTVKLYIPNSLQVKAVLKVGNTVLYLLLFVIAVSFTVTSTYNPFIYFNF